MCFPRAFVVLLNVSDRVIDHGRRRSFVALLVTGVSRPEERAWAELEEKNLFLLFTGESFLSTDELRTRFLLPSEVEQSIDLSNVKGFYSFCQVALQGG
jgi:hypothetical protein